MTSLLRGDVPAAEPFRHSRDINKGADLTVQEANWTNASVIRTYDRWAPLYDVVFGSIFAQARRKAVEAAEAVGGRVLEVGVGTGIALSLYRGNARVFGIDISEEMLAKARRRVVANRLTHVEDLAVMDAEKLEFPDNSFDVISAQYVVNTVPRPEKVLEEFARILRPGGEIILVNRIGAATGPRLKVEHLMQPLVKRLGWRSEFPWSRFESWMQASAYPVRLIDKTPVPPFGHFALIRFTKDASRPRDPKLTH